MTPHQHHDDDDPHGRGRGPHDGSAPGSSGWRDHQGRPGGRGGTGRPEGSGPAGGADGADGADGRGAESGWGGQGPGAPGWGTWPSRSQEGQGPDGGGRGPGERGGSGHGPGRGGPGPGGNGRGGNGRGNGRGGGGQGPGGGGSGGNPEHGGSGGEGRRGSSGGDADPHGHGHGHGHGHAHHHGPAAPVSRHLRRVIAAVLLPFTAVVLAGVVLMWPSGIGDQDERTGVGFDREMEEAEVTAIDEVPCDEVGVAVPQGVSGPCQLATVELTSGPHTGRVFEEVVPPDTTTSFSSGQGVQVAYAPDAPEELQYSIIDVERSVPIMVLALIFAVIVVLVGRLRGLLALVGLVLTFMVLTLFILPAILNGSNPLLVAVFGGSVIMLATLYLCHGLNARTSVAVLGTLISLVMIGLLGSFFIDWANLSGNTDDQTGLVHSLYPDIEIRGLLLAGILIGSLGVLDDVTVTQTSAIWELKQAEPGASWLKLYRAGMRIGRAHIASVVNTLVLAYAGAAMPLLLLFTIAQQSVTTVAFSELVAEEIVRTLIGSIGLVASVPITTVLAALVVSADREQGVGATPSDGGSGVTPWGGGGRRRRARPKRQP